MANGNDKSPTPVTGPTTTPQPTPAKTPIVDEALDEHTALVYSPKAMLAGTVSPAGKTPPPDPDQVRKDDRAVWAFIPAAFDPAKPELLLYLHGHNYFVTAKRNGTKVEGRAPDWISKANSDDNRAASKAAAQGPLGTFYKLDQLDPALPHHPIALAPENAHQTHGMKGVFEKDAKGNNILGPDNKPIPVFQKDKDGNPVLGKDGKPLQELVWDGFWAKELPGTLSTGAGMGDMVDNVFARLFVLPVVPVNGKNYLTKQIAANDIKRFFLTGHSGGGVPLAKATVSDLALKVPTTVVYLDATYADYTSEVRKFCETANLGSAKDQSKMVIIFNPDSGTEPDAKLLVADLKSAKPKKPKDPPRKAFVPTELNHTGAADLPAIEAALKTDSIVVIKTNTAHENIPGTFIPIVVRNTPAV